MRNVVGKVKFTPSYNLRENWYKMLYRLYITLTIIIKIDKTHENIVGTAITRRNILPHLVVV